jgi:hypothetical protein
MPVERCGVRTKFVPARYKQRLAMHGVVVAPVFELLAYTWANFENVVWCYCDVAMVEQAMKVSPQQ